MGWLTFAWEVIKTVAGWFGIGRSKDPRDTAFEQGENLGQAKTENSNAQAAVAEITTAVDAARRNDAALDDAPERLRDGTDPAGRPYRGTGPD